MLAPIDSGSIIAHCVRRASELVQRLRKKWEQEFSSSLIEAVGVTRFEHSLMQVHTTGPQPQSHHVEISHGSEIFSGKTAVNAVQQVAYSNKVEER